MISKDFINHPFSMLHIKDSLGVSSFYEYIKKRLFPKEPAPMALSLICGDGYEDRMMYRNGLFTQAIGVDESGEDLRFAEKVAQQENMPIRYVRTDLNLDFPSEMEEKYSLVYSTNLYFARELDQLLARVHRMLLPDGIFIFWGYCGTQRSSMQNHTFEICNRLLRCIPDQLKGDHRLIDQQMIDKLMNTVGGNNLSSEMISSTINYIFRDVEEICLGTTITYPILGPIISNFSPNDDSEISIMLLLQVMEQIMIRYRVIGSNMKMIIGRRKL